MRRLLPRLVPALALAAMTATGARAQDMERTASRFDIGVYAGGSLTSGWFDSYTVTLNGTATPTENDDEETFSPGYAPAFGALANFWVTPALGLRLHGAYMPMRQPTAEGLFEGAGERANYTLNTYVADLSLIARPFITRDVSRWLSSVYLFAGGGALGVDVTGEDRIGCEAQLQGLGACLPLKPRHTIVGQGTAGAGMDLFQLGGLAIFGEAAAHVYDSPVHTGDEWVGAIRAPQGATVRIADDRTAVTGRLVLGAKAMFGNQLRAPVVVPPPPPVVQPPVVQPPPPPPVVDTMRDIQVCVLENGALRNVTAQYNTQTADTMYQGRDFATAFPSTTGYAQGATWYINNEPITINGRRYVRYGLPRVLTVNEVTRAGEFQGVSVFAETGATGTPEVLYVPVRTGCEFQPYQLEVKAGAVRGD